MTSPRPRAPRLLAVTALACAAVTVPAGCGIEPSDVIDAGAPASGVKAPGRPETGVQLFFYGPAGLRSATRPAKAPADPQFALDLLLDGPDHAERQRGLSSALPELPGRLRARAGDGQVDIVLPVPPRKLDTAALSQLVCTAANAEVPGGHPPSSVRVTLTGSGSRVGPMICAGDTAFPVVQPSAVPSSP
ncbi:hypothetical protein [Streptomyces sp. NPDC059080]|uniref:hypothetical protein n=1 Tax=Streptomyces sp. NPDC059080 TaxID=3346718 RepID=UPI0036B221D5